MRLLAKVRVAGSNPVVRSKVLVTPGIHNTSDSRSHTGDEEPDRSNSSARRGGDGHRRADTLHQCPRLGWRLFQRLRGHAGRTTGTVSQPDRVHSVDSCRAFGLLPIKRRAERSPGQVPKRNRVWANSPLAKDSTLLGWT